MEGSRWNFLLQALEKSIKDIIKQNPKNTVSIINCESTAHIDYENRDPNFINIKNTTFHNGGTDFAEAFAEAAIIVKKSQYTNNINLIFMTDGGDTYPQAEIDDLKNYLSSSGWKNRNLTFEFSYIACETSEKGEKFIVDLKGKSFDAQSANQLQNIYAEIISGN